VTPLPTSQLPLFVEAVAFSVVVAAALISPISIIFVAPENGRGPVAHRTRLQAHDMMTMSQDHGSQGPDDVDCDEDGPFLLPTLPNLATGADDQH
jgi:hypothetical protein